MSKLVLSENLFLEVAELKRMLKYLDEYGYKRLVKNIINGKSGIVTVDDVDSFLVSKVADTTISINPGLAFDSEAEAIVNTEIDYYEVDDNGNTKWVILSRATNHIEEGTVSVTQNGVLSGIGTKFKEVLRGQPNFPNKVKFNSANNSGEYEVVSVISDTDAIISGSFTAESNIKYSVIGTFTPGFVPTEENKFIYEKDHYQIAIVESESVPQIQEGLEFIIGKIFYSEGIMYVNDERYSVIFNQRRYSLSEMSGVNPILSLVSVKAMGGLANAEIEFLFEHGYQVQTYQYNLAGNNTTFVIQTGSNNVIDSNIYDDLFNGWLLINRKNMRSSEISHNVGSTLYFKTFDQEMIENSGNDFIIVPNYTEVEFEISFETNSTNFQEPFYFRKSIENMRNRCSVYVLYPEITGEEKAIIHLRYRMITEDGRRLAFNDFPISQFNNVNGESETLANSDFEINVQEIEPEAAHHNYS